MLDLVKGAGLEVGNTFVKMWCNCDAHPNVYKKEKAGIITEKEKNFKAMPVFT